jgi:hypothetical protein
VTARPNLLAAALVGVVALAVLAAGCGNDDGEDEGAEAPPPVAKPEDFPKAEGTSIAELRKQYGMGGPVLVPAVSQFEPGKNRFGFGLFFPRTRAQIANAPVALYVAPAGGGAVKGPFPARYESLKVEPQFQSRSVSSDPDSARTIYAAELEFEKPGRYEVLGLARLDDRLVAATPTGAGLRVVKKSPVPDLGDTAPKTHTPTKASVGGDVEQIDTRVPPSTMHEEDFAEVLGTKPVVLLFATPALCQSRVCGPVVDIAEQVKAEHGDEVEFIHMEIYNDNELEKGFRPQVLQWRLPTEPWLFAVDGKGRIAARLEGAFSARELEQAVRAASRS